MLLMRLVRGDTAAQMTLTVLLGLAVIVPIASLLMPVGSPLHLGDYAVTLLGKFLCLAMLALALDLIWGYCGLLSLGHGAFFALGGYAMGMYLMRQIGDRGQYGHPVLPDFMVFLNWQELPWFWWGFDGFGWTLLMILFVPGLLAGLVGWLAFRSRVNGVYFSIITQAMTYALMLAFFRNELGFGGNNGLTDFKDLLGFDLRSSWTRCGLFSMTAILLALTFLLCRSLMASPFGKVVVAVRDAPARARFLGYPVEHYQLGLFVLSAVIAAIAGALYVPQVGIINPGEFQPLNSIEVAVWVALGGRGTLHGAMLGALVVNSAESLFTALLPEVWIFFLGALFVGSTLFLPRGLVGLAREHLPALRSALIRHEDRR